jgi:large subunit ribosomal protein L32
VAEFDPHTNCNKITCQYAIGVGVCSLKGGKIMPLPKRKFSKSRRDKRRTHWKLDSPQLNPCPQCGKPKPAHRICPHCGYYKGRQVIEMKEKKEEKK